MAYKGPKPQYCHPHGVQVITSDNPWFQNNRRSTRKDNPGKKAKFGIGAHHRYELEDGFGTMKTVDLMALGPAVQSICHRDCYLFQWVTCPMMYPDGFQVMEAWGFRYITVAHVWVKLYYPSMDSFMGPGGYTFSNAELVLLGGRGRLWHSNEKGCVKNPQEIVSHYVLDEEGEYQEIPQTVVDRCTHPRIMTSYLRPDGTERSTLSLDHSTKPETLQDLIDRWLTPQLKPGSKPLELFARRSRPGWDCMGAALSGRDIRDDIREFKTQLDFKGLFPGH